MEASEPRRPRLHSWLACRIPCALRSCWLLLRSVCRLPPLPASPLHFRHPAQVATVSCWPCCSRFLVALPVCPAAFCLFQTEQRVKAESERTPPWKRAWPPSRKTTGITRTAGLRLLLWALGSRTGSRPAPPGADPPWASSAPSRPAGSRTSEAFSLGGFPTPPTLKLYPSL